MKLFKNLYDYRELLKTNVKKDIVLGTETLSCLIPWESLVAESEGGYLVVGLKVTSAHVAP